MASRSVNAPSSAAVVRLGLIGDNIKASRSPDLHRIAGQLCGLEVRYELCVPAELGLPFEAVFDACRREGMRGVNITYPYKESVLGRLSSANPDVTRVGSTNTVVFTPDGPVGHNTDYLGFMAAYRSHFGDRAVGRVGIVGAGGVGRAIAFALAALGASELRLFDADPDRASYLAAALSRAENMPVYVGRNLAEVLHGVDGVVNCTPVGMIGNPGSAVPIELLGGQGWAFDAVYTPVETEFLRLARGTGLDTLSGYELFFHQGVEAFELFTGRLPPLDALRRQLIDSSLHKAAS